MSPEIVTILVLVAMFVVATLVPVNMGAIAFGAAFVVGTVVAGLSADDVISGVGVHQVLTLIGIVVLAVGIVAFELDPGFLSIVIAVLLAVAAPHVSRGAVAKISWSTVLLICGVLTYIEVLREVGTVEFAGAAIAGLGSALLAALLLCYLGGITSAFASSTAIMGVIIPLAVPFLARGDIGAIGMVAALAVASTIVDVSPFSTNGALVLANVPEDVDRDRFYRQMLAYSGVVVAIGPALAWLVLVVPGWI